MERSGLERSGTEVGRRTDDLRDQLRLTGAFLQVAMDSVLEDMRLRDSSQRKNDSFTKASGGFSLFLFPSWSALLTGHGRPDS